MGFGREARRVRDETLSHGHRLRALAHCLQWAQPIGFHPSWHYLEAKLDAPRESIEFLTPAIDLLERERTLHLELDQRYSTLRRQQKMRGSRSPRSDAVTPRSPARWYGDEREAAVHALRSWFQRYPLEDFVDQHEAKLAVDVARSLASGQGPTAFDPTALQQSLDWARAGARGPVNQTMTERRRAHQVLRLLGHVHMVLHGAPLVGSPWNFTASPSDRAHSAAVARAYFRTPLGLWRSTPHDGVSHLSGAAADLLMLGYDTPALRELAGLSPSDSFYEVEPAVITALDELEIGDLLGPSTDRAGLEARLVLFLGGTQSLRELSTWAHHVIGHEGEDDLQPFVVLDDICDVWEQTGQDLSHLDLVTRKAARDFLASHPVTQLDRLESPGRTAAQSNAAHPPSWRNRLRRRRRSAT